MFTHLFTYGDHLDGLAVPVVIYNACWPREVRCFHNQAQRLQAWVLLTCVWGVSSSETRQSKYTDSVYMM